MKKTIIVHIDTYLNDNSYEICYTNKPEITKKIATMCQEVKNILSEEQKIYKINQFNQDKQLPDNKAIYILNNGTTVWPIAKKIINKGDDVVLLGLYIDACLENIKNIAEKKWTNVVIHNNASMHSDDFI